MKKISTIAYKRIYTFFTKKVYKEELTDLQKKSLKGIDYNIWGITGPGKDGTNFFDRIFAEYKPARDHFWKKLGNYKPENANFVPMHNEVLIAMFNYIGIKLPKDLPKHDQDNEVKKANAYYDEFLKLYPDSDYIKVEDEVGIFLEQQYTMAKGNYFKNTRIDRELIERAVTAYYEALGKRDFVTAFNFLFEKSSTHAANKLQNFEHKNSQISSISGIHVWDIHLGINSGDYFTGTCKAFILQTNTSDIYGHVEIPIISQVSLHYNETWLIEGISPLIV